jgi:hypothetical protein
LPVKSGGVITCFAIDGSDWGIIPITTYESHYHGTHNYRISHASRKFLTVPHAVTSQQRKKTATTQKTIAPTRPTGTAPAASSTPTAARVHSYDDAASAVNEALRHMTILSRYNHDYLYPGEWRDQAGTRHQHIMALDVTLPVHDSGWTCTTTLPGFLESSSSTQSAPWIYHHHNRSIHLFRERDPVCQTDVTSGHSTQTTQPSHRIWQCDPSPTPSDDHDWLYTNDAQPSPLSIKEGRKSVAVISYNNMILLIGGISMTKRTVATVEAYNSDTSKWSSLPSLIYARSSCHVVNINGQITVIGGNDGKQHHVPEVEILNRKKRCWELATWYMGRCFSCNNRAALRSPNIM